MFGASEDPLHELVLERGHRADRRRRPAGARRRRTRGHRAGRRTDCRGRSARRASRPSWRSTRWTIAEPQPARSTSHRLGFDPIFAISAEHGEGIGDLLDEVVRRLGSAAVRPPVPDAEGHIASGAPDDATALRRTQTTPRTGAAAQSAQEVAVAIVGRPNAGKSSLVNRLLREERMIVSEVPGTTRDAVDAVLQWHRRQFRIVDTAGIRRPGRVAQSGQVESVSVLLAAALDRVGRYRRAGGRCRGRRHRSGCSHRRRGRPRRPQGIIIVANKWDLTEGS